MSKASNQRNNFLKKRVAKMRRAALKSSRKKASKSAAKNVFSLYKNFRENSQTSDFSEKTIDAKKSRETIGLGENVQRGRNVPDYVLAEDFMQSDSHGNLRRNPVRRNDGRPPIAEMVREATAGGVIYRLNQKKELEILLVADHFDRWTIPKGHIEEGETAQETAIREIGEEAGLFELEPICWLGKIHFRYRRQNTLVLMSTQIYLFQALGDTNQIKAEDWMNGIKWFSFAEAVDIIAYEDIAKLMLLGRNRLRQRGRIQ